LFDDSPAYRSFALPVMVHPAFPSSPLQKNHWDLPIVISRNLSVLFEIFLPTWLGIPKTPQVADAKDDAKIRGSNSPKVASRHHRARCMAAAMNRFNRTICGSYFRVLAANKTIDPPSFADSLIVRLEFKKRTING